MKQKYKSGDLLVDSDGYILEVIGRSTVGDCYLLGNELNMFWSMGYMVDSLEKIGTI